MTASAFARDAYSTSALATTTPRSAEFKALSRATSRLRRAAESRHEKFPAFVAALSHNLKVWTVFAADVAHDGNDLPRELRAQIFALAQFVSAHTHKLFNGDSDTAPDILITINNNIMQGLNGAAPAGAR